MLKSPKVKTHTFEMTGQSLYGVVTISSKARNLLINHSSPVIPSAYVLVSAMNAAQRGT